MNRKGHSKLKIDQGGSSEITQTAQVSLTIISPEALPIPLLRTPDLMRRHLHHVQRFTYRRAKVFLEVDDNKSRFEGFVVRHSRCNAMRP